MPGRTFSLTGYVAERRKMHKRLFKASLKGIRKAAKRAKKEVQRQIDVTKPYAPIDRGKMRRGWKVGNTPDGAILTSTEDYTKYQEAGTKPFTPPFKVLLKWAKRKVRGRAPLFSGASRARGRSPKSASSTSSSRRRPTRRLNPFRSKASAARDQAARQLAGAAWASIRKHGIKPKRFFAEASKKFPGFVDDEVLRALRNVKA